MNYKEKNKQFSKDCETKDDLNSLEDNVEKYETIDGNIIITSPGVKTIIPKKDVYDGPDY